MENIQNKAQVWLEELNEDGVFDTDGARDWVRNFFNDLSSSELLDILILIKELNLK